MFLFRCFFTVSLPLCVADIRTRCIPRCRNVPFASAAPCSFSLAPDICCLVCRTYSLRRLSFPFPYHSVGTVFCHLSVVVPCYNCLFREHFAIVSKPTLYSVMAETFLSIFSICRADIVVAERIPSFSYFLSTFSMSLML